MIYKQAITGSDAGFEAGSTQSVLQAFYQAFNTANLQQMTANWLQTDEASMSNPLGGVRRGWNEIAGVYERIFIGKAEVYVEFYDYSIHHYGDLFCAVGKERGYFKSNDEELALAIRTSRVYRKQENQWLQLHHHGSIDSPELLKAYQSAVIK